MRVWPPGGLAPGRGCRSLKPGQKGARGRAGTCAVPAEPPWQWARAQPPWPGTRCDFYWRCLHAPRRGCRMPWFLRRPAARPAAIAPLVSAAARRFSERGARRPAAAAALSCAATAGARRAAARAAVCCASSSCGGAGDWEEQRAHGWWWGGAVGAGVSPVKVARGAPCTRADEGPAPAGAGPSSARVQGAGGAP